MAKLVIPVKNDVLSSSFNYCSYFLIYTIENREIISKKVNFFKDDFRSRIAEWSETAGITDVIVHYIDETSLEILSASKINLFVGVKISSPDRLVEDFLEGTLKSDTHNMVEKCGF